jgi:hypothetical protein
MSEEFNEAQVVEVAAPQDEGTQASEVETKEVQKPSSDEQERNWRSLRQAKEEADRKNQAYERQIAEYTSLVKELVVGKQQQNQVPEEVEDDADIPTFAQTKKTVRREAEKIAREIVSETLAKREQAEAPRRLVQEYADFDEVVSKENVDYLIKNEPELAAILGSVGDQYNKGKAAYKFIKNLNISKSKDVESMKKDASKNSVKPVSPNAIAGRNSVGDANTFSRGLTPDLKKQLYQEMMDAIKRG